MAEYQFTLIAQHRPEVLERILRVIRHRGFVVTQMQMQKQETQVQLELTVQSQRHLDLLLNQLVKLPNVVEISL